MLNIAYCKITFCVLILKLVHEGKNIERFIIIFDVTCEKINNKDEQPHFC